MTHSFNSDSIVAVDGFIYCLDKKHYVTTTDYALGVSGKIYPPASALQIQMGGIYIKEREVNIIMATNNPDLKEVPQLPELVQDVEDIVFRELKKHWAAPTIGEVRAGVICYEAASKKQFTLEDLEKCWYVSDRVSYNNHVGIDNPDVRNKLPKDFNDYKASLPKPIPKELTIDIDGEGNVTIKSITF